MTTIRHTLVSDGVTDTHLIPIIDWTLRQLGGIESIQGVRADFWRLPTPPSTLSDRLIQAVELHPCDILFVHRDTENASRDQRGNEIRDAVRIAATFGVHLPAVAVIPVRMLEAWLCFNEKAIRHAAGNPNGIIPLNLPSLTSIEERPDPKNDLRIALERASELTGRRLKKFNRSQAFWNLVEFITDFAPLRFLPAFNQFESAVKNLRQAGWKKGVYL